MKEEITPQGLPDYPSDTTETMEQIVNAITQEDGYWGERIRAACSRAGFTVRRLEREPMHPSVWVAYLNVRDLQLLPDKTSSSKQIRLLLRKAGLRIRAGELSVLDQRRNGRVKCAFVLGSQMPVPDV